MPVEEGGECACGGRCCRDAISVSGFLGKRIPPDVRGGD
jgi:hypothetical protein